MSASRIRGLRKFFGSLRIAYRMVMARTFGRYAHSIGGAGDPEVAVYDWRGARYWIQTKFPQHDELGEATLMATAIYRKPAMTLEEAKIALAAKREQLITYRDRLDGDDDVIFHARTMANGRIAQIEQDIHTLNQIQQ